MRRFLVSLAILGLIAPAIPSAARGAEPRAAAPVPGTIDFARATASRSAAVLSASDVGASAPLAPLSNMTLHGGYVAAGVGMRNRGYGSVTVSGIPSGSTVLSAYLFWDILGDSLDPSYGVGRVNGQAVSGTLVGTGGNPCWGNAANFAFRSDVTGIVNGNGEYALSGFASHVTDGRDPFLQYDHTPPLTEGASLVVTYQNAQSPETQFFVYEGAAEDAPNTLSQVLGDFTAPSAASAKTTFIGGDGQSEGEPESTFNGSSLPSVGWDGEDPQAGPAFSDGNLWDTMTVDVSALIPAGSTSAVATIGGEGDCHVWVAQVLSISSGPGGQDTYYPEASWFMSSGGVPDKVESSGAIGGYADRLTLGAANQASYSAASGQTTPWAWQWTVVGPGQLKFRSLGGGSADVSVDGQKQVTLQGGCSNGDYFNNEQHANEQPTIDITGSGNHDIRIDNLVGNAALIAKGTPGVLACDWMDAWLFDGIYWNGGISHFNGDCISPLPDRTYTNGRTTVSYPPFFIHWDSTKGVLAGGTTDSSEEAAKLLADRSNWTLNYYQGIGLPTPTEVEIHVNCQINLLPGVPGLDSLNYGDRPGYTTPDPTTPGKVIVQLSLHQTRDWIQSGDRSWKVNLDHELFHGVQIQAKHKPGATWNVLPFPGQDNRAIAESSAVLAQDLVPDNDDSDPMARQWGGAPSYLAELYRFMENPVDVTGLGQPNTAGPQVHGDNPMYEIGGFLQWLGERHGDQNEPNLEKRVGDWVLYALVADGHAGESAFASALGGDVNFYTDLMDYYVAAQIHASQSTGKYSFADEHQRNYTNTSGTPPSYPSLSGMVFSHTIGSLPFRVPVSGWTTGVVRDEVLTLPSGVSNVNLLIEPAPHSGEIWVRAIRYGATDQVDTTAVGQPTRVRPGSPQAVPIDATGFDHKVLVQTVAFGGSANYDLVVDSDAYGLQVVSPSTSNKEELFYDFGGYCIRIHEKILVGGVFQHHLDAIQYTSGTIGSYPVYAQWNPSFEWADEYAFDMCTTTRIPTGTYDLTLSFQNTSVTVAQSVVVPSVLPPMMVKKALTGSGAGGADISGLLAVQARGAKDPIVAQLYVTDGLGAVTDAQATATITSPTGIARTFPLRDDGSSWDGQAGDGNYGVAAWATDATGQYHISISASKRDAQGVVHTWSGEQTVTLGPAVDADGDGVSDESETMLGLDPANPADGLLDPDGDGLTTAQELSAGTDPFKFDTDGGGEGDSSEIATNRDPRAAADDRSDPGVQLAYVLEDGYAVHLVLGTADGVTPVDLYRLTGTDRVNLGRFTGQTASFIDHPATHSGVRYQAVAVDPTGAQFAPSNVGPLDVSEDVTAPEVVLTLAGGRWVTDTRSIAVDLSASSTDLTQVRFAEDEQALGSAPWVAYAPSTTFTLNPGPGPHYVYVQARDAAGNLSSVQSAAVVLDDDPPVSSVGPVPAQTSASQITLDVSTSDTTQITGSALWVRFRSTSEVAWGGWSQAINFTTPSVSYSFAHGVGYYEFAVTSVDSAGNREQVSPTGRIVSYGQPAISVNTASFSSAGVDTNGDGLFESLRFGGELTATTPGQYRISADLVAQDQRLITTAAITKTLAVGDNAVSLEFHGPEIRETGIQGPYIVRNLQIYAVSMPDQAVSPPTTWPTAAYAPQQFSMNLVSHLRPYSDWPISQTFIQLQVDCSTSDFELWQRFKPAGASTFRDWHKDFMTESAQPAYVDLTDGDGTYEFYSLAVYPASGDKEDPPAIADTSVVLDTTAPVGVFGTIPSYTNVAALSIPISVTDLNGSGVASAAIYARYRPTIASQWGYWQLAASGTGAETSLNVTLSQGEGFYEFGIQASDKTNNVQYLPSSGTPIYYSTTGAPASRALPIGGFTNQTSLLIPYDAHFVSGSPGSLDLYERFQPTGGSFGEWTKVASANSPAGLTAPLTQGDGRYEFVTRGTDSGTGGVEAQRTAADAFVVLDTTLPVSSMTHNQPLPIQRESVYLEANSSDEASGLAEIRFYYRYKHLDTDQFGEWKLLASTTQPYAGDNTIDCPVPLHGLSYCRVLDFIPSEGEGYYEVSSVAVDKAGNVEAKEPAKSAFRLDNTAPTVTVTSPVATKSTWASISYTVTDPSGVGSVELYERYTSPGESPSPDGWWYVRMLSSSPATVQLNQGEGTYDFYLLASDSVGNRMSQDWVVQASITRDATVPTASLTSLPAHITSASQTVAYSTADNSGGSGVQTLQIQRQFKGTGSWLPLATITAPPSSGSAPVTLADGYGSYQFRAVATDYAGNVTTSALTSATSLDPPAPTTQAGPLAPAVKVTTLSVPYTVTSGTTTSVALYQRFTSPGVTPSGSFTKLNLTPSNGAFSVTLANDGLYEFYTLGTGTGGTESQKSTGETSTVRDTQLPTSQASPVTTSRNTNSVVVSFTASDNPNGAGLKSVDLYERFTPKGGSAGSPTVIAAAATSPVAVTLGSEGLYEFWTVATDKAGNVEATPGSADATTVYDVTAPASTPAPPAGTHATSLLVPFTATDTNGSGVKSVQLYERYTALGGTPSGGFTPVGSPTTTSPIAVTLGSIGRYEFYTIATDNAGNVQAAPTSNFGTTIYETTAPTSQASALPTFITSTTLAIAFTSADEVNGSGMDTTALYFSYEAPGSTTWSNPTTIGSAVSGTSGTFNVTLTSGAGSYRFYTLATDKAGNVEAAPGTPDATTVLDPSAPTSSITAPPSTSSASSISLTYSASDTTNGSGFNTIEFWYRYRTGDGATPTSWTQIGSASSSASGTFTLNFGSGAGIYDVLTVAVDKAGNREGGIASTPASSTAGKWSIRATSWNAGSKVNTDAGTALQDNASYVVGSDGTVYAVWEDSRNGNTDIYFSSRNPSTGAWAAETKLNTDTGTAGQRTPSIAIDGSGNLYVVWADDRNGASNTDIYFRKRTGTIWSAADAKVNSDTTSAIQSQPRIAVSSSGVAVAVWYDARSSQVNIYSGRLPAGLTTWTNYKVTSNTSAVKAAPDVAVYSDGSAWATWQDNQSGGGDIYVASLAAGGTAWSTNTKVSDDSGSSSVDKSPRIGLTSAGLPVVAYLDGRSTNAQVRIANRTSGGVWNPTTVQVSDASAKPSGGLALAVKADGGVIVAWDDTRSTSAIWGAQCEAGSGSSPVTRCAPAEKWSDQTGASYRPTIIATTSTVYLGWRDDTAGNGDIRIRLRKPS